MRGRYAALSLLALAAGLAGGVAVERFYLNPAGAAGGGGPEILYWVAPMDPNFRRDGPGKSPMGMDLIPVYAGQEPSGDPAEVTLSAAEINSIGVRTALAQMSEISERIETVGFVTYDEHLTSRVHTRVEGWVERLNLRAVGDRAREGDVLFEMFSPVIGASSAEYLRALESGDQRIIQAALGKLRSHDMSERQIAEIETRGTLSSTIEVVAPQDGVVVALDVADGAYVQPGTRALTLADLSAVWLIVDVFERDIARLTDDMRAVARFEHLPGRTFEGAIDYVYPELDPKTRTLPVRLRFDNAEGLLLPNMFGTVTLSPRETRTALTVPTEAVIRTGAADRVILRTGEGTFRPRLITTGLRDGFGQGGRTEVMQGLAPGEEVVASAQFLIDSESALGAGLTRMAPTDEAPARGAGELVALDRETRLATIRHEALASLDWPAMVSTFPVRADVDLERVFLGQQVAFRAARGVDGLLGLLELGADDGVAATGTGTIHAVTADGKLTLSHDPIPELGWPAMRMDLPVAGLDPAQLPVEAPVEFDLSEGEDGLYVVVAVRTGAGEAGMAGKAPAAASSSPAGGGEAPEDSPGRIVVTGTIDAVDPRTRTTTVTYGPMPDIGLPGRTMSYAIAEGLDPGSLRVGASMTLTFDRPNGMTVVLVGAEPLGSVPDEPADPPPDQRAAPPMEVTGTINAIDAGAGTVNATHGPMLEIGMPGMTMDFAVDPALDAASLPTGAEVTLLLRRNPDFSMTLVGTRPADPVVGGPGDGPVALPADPPAAPVSQ